MLKDVFLKHNKNISYFTLQLLLTLKPYLQKTYSVVFLCQSYKTDTGNWNGHSFKWFVCIKNKAYWKTVHREFGCLWINLKVCIRFSICASVYLSKLLSIYQPNYTQILLVSPPDLGVCLFYTSKKNNELWNVIWR